MRSTSPSTSSKAFIPTLHTSPRSTTERRHGPWTSSRPPFGCRSWPRATTLRYGQIGDDGKMIGGAERIRAADDLDAGDPIVKRRRHEDVVEPHVRIP